jgi:flagellar hook-length control protein FliK
MQRVAETDPAWRPQSIVNSAAPAATPPDRFTAPLSAGTAPAARTLADTPSSDSSGQEPRPATAPPSSEPVASASERRQEQEQRGRDERPADTTASRSTTQQPATAAPSAPATPTAAVPGRIETPSPASSVAGAIAAEPSWRPATVASATQALAYRGSLAPRTLQIQLNPGHLGSVQASLTLSGAQLEIEIQVESHEALERLKGEKHVIEQALRSIGYDLAQVSITQSMIASQQAGRSDPAPAALPSAGQPGSQQADANSSSGGNGSNGQQTFRAQEGSGDGGQAAPRSVAGDPRGVYI